MMIDAARLPGHRNSAAPQELASPGDDGGRAERVYDASLYATVFVRLWEHWKANTSDGWRPSLWPYQSRIRTPGWPRWWKSIRPSSTAWPIRLRAIQPTRKMWCKTPFCAFFATAA